MAKIVLFLAIFPLFCVDASFQTHRQNNNFYSTIKNIQIALNYMKNNVNDLNIDTYFGIILTNVYLNNINSNNAQLKNILNISSDILTSKKSNFIMDNPHLENIEKFILNQKLWKKATKICDSTLNCELKYSNQHSSGNDIDFISSPDEFESDVCLSEIISVANKLNKKYHKNENKQCPISKKCYNAIMIGQSEGYSNTHRLLYFLLCRMEGCIICGGKDTNLKIKDLCCAIMKEAKDIEIERFPYDLRDLFMEQVVLCAVAGYFEVIKPKWIELIKTWQRPQGCWGYYDAPSFNNRKIHRRSTTSLGPDSCSSHMTALGITSLALSLYKPQCASYYGIY